MKRFNLIMALLTAGLIMSSCGSVALTGRKQLLLVSDQEVYQAGLTQYNEYIASSQLSSDTKNTAIVKSVGQKLAAATEQYLKANGLESELKNFAWEFNLVKDKQVNAFCMPGGKVVHELPVISDTTEQSTQVVSKKNVGWII